MYSLLTGIDKDEEHARRQGQAITTLKTEGLNVKVHLLHVFNEETDVGITDLDSTEVIKPILEEHDIEVSFHEDTGNPARQIVSLAQELDTSAICVAGRKQSPTGKVLFGSITQSVLLSSDRTVIVPGINV